MFKNSGGVQSFITFEIDKNFKIYYGVTLIKFMKFVVLVKNVPNGKNLRKLENV